MIFIIYQHNAAILKDIDELKGIGWLPEEFNFRPAKKVEIYSCFLFEKKLYG
jgi:hypothetical protein